MKTEVTSPIKWHGGKFYLADRIISLMPKHVHYVEPYFGSGAVLFAKNPEGISEVANDINGELVNFWSVLANPSLFDKMVRILQATPCSEGRYEQAELSNSKRLALFPDRIPDGVDRVSRAVDFFVLCRQSRAATFKGFTTLAKTRTRRGMNELPSAWWTAIDGLAEIHTRLSRVVILNQPATECIQKQDGPATLFYCDPPYVHETRVATDAYEYEMGLVEHAELLAILKWCKGSVMLSGYDSDLYRKELASWSRHEFELPNNAAGGESKRKMTEVVWCNF